MKNKKWLRNETCPTCGKDNLAVWELGSGQLQKYCFTKLPDGSSCTYKGENSSSFTPLGGEVDEKFLTATSFKSEILKIYGISQDGLKFYFNRKEPSGKAHSTLCRDYEYQKKEDGHWRWIGSGASTLFYGMDTCKSLDTLILTEGFFDAAAAHQLTGYSAVSIPNGVDSAEKSIKHNWTWLKQYKEILIIFDNDEVGQATAARAANLIGYRAKVVVLPSYDVQLEGRVVTTKDSFDFLKFHLESYYLRAIEAARNSNQPFLVTEDIDAEYEEYLLRGSFGGWSTGIKEVDNLFTFRPHESTVLFGSPGRGKSSLLRYFCYEVQQQGVKVYYLSLEESLVKAISAFAKVYELSGEPKEVAKAVRERILLGDISSFISPEVLHDCLEYAIIGYGAQFLAIDHITWLLDLCADPVKTARDYMHVIADICKKYPVHVLAISHNKPKDEAIAMKGKATRELSPDWEEYIAPTIRDAQWSSTIGQTFWNVIGWKKPTASNEPGRLYLVKSRTEGIDKLGRVMLYFNQENNHFMSAGKYASKKHSARNTVLERSTSQVQRETREGDSGDVPSPRSEVSVHVRPLPSPTSEPKEGNSSRESRSQNRSELEDDSDNDRAASISQDEVHSDDTGLLLSGNQMHNRDQGRNDARISCKGRGFQTTPSHLVQALSASFPEAGGDYKRSPPLLPVGRQSGNTVVSLRTDEAREPTHDNPRELVSLFSKYSKRNK